MGREAHHSGSCSENSSRHPLPGCVDGAAVRVTPSGWPRAQTCSDPTALASRGRMLGTAAPPGTFCKGQGLGSGPTQPSSLRRWIWGGSLRKRAVCPPHPDQETNSPGDARGRVVGAAGASNKPHDSPGGLTRWLKKKSKAPKGQNSTHRKP